MKKSLIPMKFKAFVLSRAVAFSALVLLVGFFVLGLSDRSVSQPSITRTSTTTAQQAEQMVDSGQYTRVDLADVESYAAASENNFVVTSGIVVGIKVTPSQLVLSDSKDTYVLVTFARVDTDQFAPIFSSLRVGDTVEVRGTASVTQGVLVSSPGGVTVEAVGVNLADAPSLGIISLTGITKME